MITKHFKRQCLCNALKPWRERNITYPQWGYREEYGSSKFDHDLTLVERKKQWFQYLDFWFMHCLKNEYFYIDQVELTQNVYDVGIFCKEDSSLSVMHRKIYGFLEVIDEETFEMLRFQKHPSLYEDYRHVDEDDPHFTPKKKYFIIFGALSCVNSDVGLPIKFSHRDRSCAYEDNLKWELVFSRETVDCEIDNIESYEIIYDIDVIEVKERDGISATVGDVLYSSLN